MKTLLLVFTSALTLALAVVTVGALVSAVLPGVGSGGVGFVLTGVSRALLALLAVLIVVFVIMFVIYRRRVRRGLE